MSPIDEGLIPSQQLRLPEKYSHLSPEEYVQALTDYIEKYRRWTTLHIVDFITYNQWEILDEEWRNVLLPQDGSLGDDWIDSIVQITSGSDVNKDWPESLRNFIQDTKDIALPRVNAAGSEQIKSDIDRRILAGMVEKKIHEVERMTPVIRKIAKDHGVESVVDLGAGQGYLSRSLAFKTNLKVLAVDSSEIQTCGAKKFDDRAVKFLDKDDLKLHHVTDFITPENASTILSKWGNHDTTTQEKWLLCGLHTCGDLASMMLRLFTSSPEITCLVSVGCCYHFLTEKHEHNDMNETQLGFPVSTKVREIGFKLGPTARMLSCQAPARWVDQQEETLIAYEHHFFRALLQLIMVEKGLIEPSVAPVVGRLNKKRDFTSFSVYVKAASKRLKLPEDTITSEEAEKYYEEYKRRQVDKQITILWTLRVLLAPILESIILVDRWLYLNENIKDSPTKGVWLWPLFDPVTSPRNVVITATK